MDLEKNKKALLLTDIEHGVEAIMQQVTSFQPENLLTIQSFGSIISHPYGDIMRSVIIAIYQENVEEIFVLGTKDNSNVSINVLNQLESEKAKIQTLDYLFQYSIPEFKGGKVREWLIGKENGSDNIEKSVHIIRNHPLIPSYVKVRGYILSNLGGEFSIVEVPTH